MFTSLLFKGGAILLLVTACLFFAWRIVRILNPKPPRPPKYAECFVVEVRNGATIIVSKKGGGGRKGKRTKSLSLEGIASPAEGEGWFAESRDNLALFAGAKVRVQVRGLFRATKDDPHFVVCLDCGNKEAAPLKEKCSVCGGVGVKPDGNFNSEFEAWFEKHYDGCKVCSTVPTSENPEPRMCKEAKARMEKAIGDDPDACAEVLCLLCEGHGKIICFPDMLHREEYEVVCFRCGGDGKVWQTPDSPEARDVVVGTVWGESGACLNLEQLKSGWAKSVGEVPEEWAEAEEEAKKAGKGIWAGE